MHQLSDSQAHLLRRLERYVNNPTPSAAEELRGCADEIVLICQVTESEAALTAICRLYTGIIHSLVRPGKPREDQVQHGYIGLLKAVRGFDPKKASFSTYATQHISGELAHFFRDDQRVHVSRTLRNKAATMWASYYRFSKKHGREPSPDELSRESGIPTDEFEELRRIRPDLLFRDDPEGFILAGLRSSDDGRAEVEARFDLEQVLKRVPQIHAEIVRLRIDHDLKQSEIGAIVGFAQASVGRILKNVGDAYLGKLAG